MIHLFCQLNQVFRNSILYFKCFPKVEVTRVFSCQLSWVATHVVRRPGLAQPSTPLTSRGLMSCYTRSLAVVHSRFLLSSCGSKSRSHFSCPPPSGRIKLRDQLPMAGISEAPVKAVGLMVLNPESRAIF